VDFAAPAIVPISTPGIADGLDPPPTERRHHVDDEPENSLAGVREEHPEASAIFLWRDCLPPVYVGPQLSNIPSSLQGPRITSAIGV
jgi:hypothetical protein